MYERLTLFLVDVIPFEKKRPILRDGKDPSACKITHSFHLYRMWDTGETERIGLCSGA